LVRRAPDRAAPVKDEILALYLTLDTFGGNLEGVCAAAKLSYFGA